METLAPGVVRLPVSIANVYFLGDADGPWVLLDTGLPGAEAKIRAAAQERFGPDAKPVGIVLTHGHSDHVGSANDLASAWDVPVYAHPLEMPYLTGQALYPPSDPTVGGVLAFLTRFSPANGQDLRPHIQPLPADGSVPGLPDWQWLPTPGHAPGHVALWRESDRTLLAGDALATVNLDSLPALLTQQQQITRPPSPMNCDWGAARASVERLAALAPAALGCGHGNPMSGPAVALGLSVLAADFPIPAQGRYVSEPARTDAEGIISLPPPAPDPLPRQLALGAALIALVCIGSMRSMFDKRASA